MSMTEILTKEFAKHLKRGGIVPSDCTAEGLRQFLCDLAKRGEYDGRRVAKDLPLDKIDYDLLSKLINDPATGRPNKLDEGTKIRIVGDLMLKGLRNGECYMIVALHPSAYAYILRRLTKSGKISKSAGTQGYYYQQIDSRLTNDLNRVEVI